MMERAVPILPGDDLAVAREFYADRAPMDEEWGARTFGVHDPFGNSIFVIEPLPKP